MSTIPWRRVRRGLAQFARQHGYRDAEVAKVMRVLPRVLALCGDESHSRKAAFRIACALLQQPIQLFVPMCPDFLYEDDRITYKGLGSGIPILFRKHMVFLNQVVQLVPNAQVTIILADHEGEPEELRRKLHVTSDEFAIKIRGSFEAIRVACPDSWYLMMFTDMFPGFIEQTWQHAHVLLQDPVMRKSIEWEAYLRTALHTQIGYASGRRLEITAHAVAQYLCFGEKVVRMHGLICNHTTTSLKWYHYTHAAVLHNPVKSV